MKKIGITIYSCEQDELEAFNMLSPRYGVLPAMTRFAVSESNALLAEGNQCVSVGHKTRVPAPTLRALQKAGVKYLSTRSVGINHIDVQAAESMGITVENVAYSPGSVADYTLMLMLMAVRNAKSIVNGTGYNDALSAQTRGRELRDMTVGVLGTGRIGKAVIERLRGFGCQVLAYDRHKDAAVSYTPFHELLQRSDMLTIHVPLGADTRHLIGREQLNAMKTGAFLINTARGGVVDTEALIQALEKGKLGGAALDVLEGEEKQHDNPYLAPLQRMPNVIVTPHTAYYTGRALRDTALNTLLNCLDFERSTCHG